MSESRKTNVFQMIAMDTICPGSMLLRQWIRSGRRLHNICERPYVLHLLNGGRFYFIIIIIIVTRSRTIYSSPTYTKENLKHTERPELMKSNGKFKTDCKRKISGWSHSEVSRQIFPLFLSVVSISFSNESVAFFFLSGLVTGIKVAALGCSQSCA